MRDGPIIFVAGLGRCGSSLVMQMLDAAGVPCVGAPPGYEDMVMTDLNGPPSAEWLAARAGHAIKWLDPHRVPIPRDLNARVLFLVRDHKEQARSQAKFASAFLRQPMPNRRDLRRWASDLARVEHKAHRIVARYPHKIIGFTELVEYPALTALKICEFLSPDFPGLEPFEIPRRMASVAIERPAECLPNLDIEIRLSEEEERRAKAPG